MQNKPLSIDPPSAPNCVINCVVYDRASQRKEITLDAISDVLAQEDGSFVWVGLYEPSDAILDKLQEEFDLHDLAIEDAQHAHQRPKIEAYGNSLFVVMYTAQTQNEKIIYGETHAFLGPRYLITIRHGTSPSYAPVRERVEREPELLALGSSYGLYAILDSIVDSYQPILNEFRDAADSLEQAIFSDTYSRRTVIRLYQLKRELVQMRLAVGPLQDVLSQFSRMQGTLVPEEVRLYFRDVHDHAQRVNESLDTLREMLSTALSVNLSLVTLGQGEVVKRLGAWAALLAAPTLVASWYGMNFIHMPELAGKYSYLVLVGAVVVVCGALYRLLKKAKWL